MRKAITALVLGTAVLGQSVIAMAATAKPAGPVAAVAGRINNRAVLSVAAAQGAADACVPKNAEDKSCEGNNGGGNNNNGGGGGGTLPIVLVGVGVIAGVGAAAGGGGGGSGPASP